MKEIKILFIIDSMARGGTQKVLIQLVEGLSKRGYSPTVVILNGGDEIFINILNNYKIKIFVFNKYNILFVGIPKILKVIYEEKIEVIQNFLFYSNNIGRILGRISKTPLIISGIRGDGQTILSWQNILDRITNPIDDGMIVNSLPAMEYCTHKIRMNREKLSLIYNGIEVTKEDPKNFNKYQLRKSFNIPEDKIIIGTAGQLAVEKGHRYLLEAMRISLNSNSKLFLIIAGTGNKENDLKGQTLKMGISKNVLFLGRCDRMNDFYQLIDIFVLPSLSEGMPNVIMEAMAQGKPVIASRISAIPELIDDELSGLLVPPANSKRLAEAITKLSENREIFEKIGKEAKNKVINSYPLEKMIDSYDQLYRKMLKEKGVF